jgi:sulfide:quinone oxidoreductase
MMIPGLHEKLSRLDHGRIAIVICSSPYKCPPAPFEAAMLVKSFLRAKGLGEAVSITVYVPELRPMMVAGPAAGTRARKVVEAQGIAVKVDHKLVSVDPATGALTFANGVKEACDLLLAIPPHVAPHVVKAAGLTGTTGWITVDPRTLATVHPNIHAMGDVTSLALPNGGFLPKAGVFAEWQGLLVAERVLAALGEPANVAEFTGQGECWFETGDGSAMIVRGSFFREGDDRVTMTEPSAEGLRLKHEFERTRLTEWFT